MTEECLGTFEFCADEKLRGKDFETAAECVASRERPYTFFEPREGCEIDQAEIGQEEECIGTLAFCEDEELALFDQGYSSTAECLAAKPKPNPKLASPAAASPAKPNKTPPAKPNKTSPISSPASPATPPKPKFIVDPGFKNDCVSKTDENCTGTIRFCNDENLRASQGFHAEAECLASRERPWTFFEPREGCNLFGAEAAGHEEECIGTEDFCNYHDWRSAQGFSTAAECLAAKPKKKL